MRLHLEQFVIQLTPKHIDLFLIAESCGTKELVAFCNQVVKFMLFLLQLFQFTEQLWIGITSQDCSLC